MHSGKKSALSSKVLFSYSDHHSPNLVVVDLDVILKLLLGVIWPKLVLPKKGIACHKEKQPMQNFVFMQAIFSVLLTTGIAIGEFI